MPLTVCFIDDSPFERRLFREVYGPTKGWDLVVAESYAQARELFGERIPLLWLLDLWGNDPQDPGPVEIMPASDLAAGAAAIPRPETVWEGLSDFPGDQANEFLKRLYTIVSDWSGLFLEAASGTDQTSAYGLYNLARVRADYPDTTALAYTRKSQSPDLAGFMAAGGDGVLLKPHGPDDPAILEATRTQAPGLLEQMHQALDRCLEAALLRRSLILSGPEGAYLYSLAGALMGLLPLPPERPFSAGPYLVRWTRAVRARLREREGTKKV